MYASLILIPDPSCSRRGDAEYVYSVEIAIKTASLHAGRECFGG